MDYIKSTCERCGLPDDVNIVLTPDEWDECECLCCDECDGDGIIEVAPSTLWDPAEHADCPYCDGTGKRE